MPEESETKPMMLPVKTVRLGDAPAALPAPSNMPATKLAVMACRNRFIS